MNRSTRIGVAVVAGLGVFVFGLLLVGSIGEPRDELQRLSVSDVLDGPPPADRYGAQELHVYGWYAELDADCQAGEQPPAMVVPWLERSCPLRVLMPYQPTLDVTQADSRGGRAAPRRARTASHSRRAARPRGRTSASSSSSTSGISTTLPRGTALRTCSHAAARPSW